MRDAAKLQQGLLWTVLLTESTHIFCCVLPTVVTVMALLASMGSIAQVPVFVLDIHEALHAYEIPIMIFSGTTLLAGWAVYAVAQRIECQKPHCDPHETGAGCKPIKNHTRTVLIIATVLLAINVTVYWTLHRPSEDLFHDQAVQAHAHDHDHHGHGHHH